VACALREHLPEMEEGEGELWGEHESGAVLGDDAERVK